MKGAAGVAPLHIIVYHNVSPCLSQCATLLDEYMEQILGDRYELRDPIGREITSPLCVKKLFVDVAWVALRSGVSSAAGGS